MRFLVASLTITMPVIKVSGKLWQPKPGRTANGLDFSEMKVWFTLSGKELQPAEVLVESKGNTEWIVEECGYEY